MELTILGFVSIILLLFRGYVEGICIPYSHTQVEWTLLNDLNNCPCCMSSTKGITTCAQMYHTCAFDSSTGEPYCGCTSGESGGDSSYAYASPPPENLNLNTTADQEGTCVAYGSNERDFIFNQFSDRIKEISVRVGQNSTRICERILDNTTITTPPNSTYVPVPGAADLRRRLQQQEATTVLAPPPPSFSSSPAADGSYLAENETLHVIPDISTFRWYVESALQVKCLPSVRLH
jgi:hypothetical protein